MTSGHHPPSRPPDDQAGHPALDALADLDAGLLDPATATAARLTSHVGGCPTCAATLRGLAAVRADLRSLPPPRMPDSVAARLDATLAELRAAGPGHDLPSVAAHRSAAGGRGEQSPAPPRTADAAADDLAGGRERRRERSRRLTTLVAASVVVLAAVGGIGTAVLHETQGGKSTVTGSAALPPDESGRRSGHSAGGDAGAPAAGHQVPQNGPETAGPAVRTVPSYTRLTLADALPEIEQQSTVAMISAAGRQGPGGVMAESARRNTCSQSIPGTIGPPTAVRQVLFERTPAFVFVFRDVGLDRRVFVVAADCGAGSKQAATVLYHLSR